MKAGWQTRKLADVLVRTETLNPEMTPDAEFDYIDVSSVSNSSFQIEQTQRIKGKDAPSRARKLVRANDVLFATIRPTLKRIAIVPSERDSQVCSTGYFVLRTNADLHHKFLYYYLFNDSFMSQMEALQKGASYPAVTDAEVRSQQISFPIIQEQQRIVTILDEAFEGIATATANAKKNLANTRELFESYLQSVFTNKGEKWIESTLGEVCEFTQGIQRDVKLQNKTQNENQVRFLRIVDFTQGNEPPRYIDNPGGKYIINDEDVSLVRYGASTGFVCRGLEGALANNLFRVIPKSFNQISNNFLFVFLKSHFFQNIIKKRMNGAAMPAISFGMIKEIPFPIISITEQQTIVAKLDELSTETKKFRLVFISRQRTRVRFSFPFVNQRP